VISWKGCSHGRIGLGAVGVPLSSEGGFIVAGFGEGWSDKGGKHLGLSERVVSATLGFGIDGYSQVWREVGCVKAKDDEARNVLAFSKSSSKCGAGLGVSEDKYRGAW
jgi:hypothetical protein